MTNRAPTYSSMQPLMPLSDFTPRRLKDITRDGRQVEQATVSDGVAHDCATAEKEASARFEPAGHSGYRQRAHEALAACVGHAVSRPVPHANAFAQPHTIGQSADGSVLAVSRLVPKVRPPLLHLLALTPNVGGTSPFKCRRLRSRRVILGSWPNTGEMLPVNRLELSSAVCRRVQPASEGSLARIRLELRSSSCRSIALHRVVGKVPARPLAESLRAVRPPLESQATP